RLPVPDAVLGDIRDGGAHGVERDRVRAARDEAEREARGLAPGADLRLRAARAGRGERAERLPAGGAGARAGEAAPEPVAARRDPGLDLLRLPGGLQQPSLAE